MRDKNRRVTRVTEVIKKPNCMFILVNRVKNVTRLFNL